MRKFGEKLSLRFTRIANLNNNEMNKVNGGSLSPSVCDPPICDTYTCQCGHTNYCGTNDPWYDTCSINPGGCPIPL